MTNDEAPMTNGGRRHSSFEAPRPGPAPSPVGAANAAAYRQAMPILGHGIDIVETERIRRLIEHHGPHFLDRVYTPLEQEYASRSPKRRIEHLAGRFAAKEAVLKVLGTGWRGGIAWTDIEIQPTPSGQPVCVLTGECQRIAESLGIFRWHVSISHIETHATASAIGLAKQFPDHWEQRAHGGG